MKLPKRFRTHSLGQSLVEFALVLPILALFLVIAVDFGRIYFTYIEVTNAAREGAAFGAVSPSNSAGIETAALQETNSQGQAGENRSGIAVTPTCKDSGGTAINCTDATNGSGPGNTITVAVSEPFSFMTPLANSFFGNFTMKKTATAIVLGYAGTGGGGGGGGTTCTSPVPSFSVVIKSGLKIHVDPTASTPNSGVCTISGYNWAWGDNIEGVGTAYGDDYEYGNAGTYTITLETTNQAGATTTTRNVTVPATGGTSCTRPTANFTVIKGQSKDSDHGNNYPYQYTDTSTPTDATCGVIGWYWTFADTTHSNAQNPTVYLQHKNEDATLVVTNAWGDSAPVTH